MKRIIFTVFADIITMLACCVLMALLIHFFMSKIDHDLAALQTKVAQNEPPTQGQQIDLIVALRSDFHSLEELLVGISISILFIFIITNAGLSYIATSASAKVKIIAKAQEDLKSQPSRMVE